MCRTAASPTHILVKYLSRLFLVRSPSARIESSSHARNKNFRNNAMSTTCVCMRVVRSSEWIGAHHAPHVPFRCRFGARSVSLPSLSETPPSTPAPDRHAHRADGHGVVARGEAAVTLSIGSLERYARVQGSKRCARTDRHAGVQGWMHLAVPSARATGGVSLVRE